MRVDVNLIERAEMLVAEVVHALFNRTADMRILAFFHEDTPFRAAAFSAAGCRSVPITDRTQFLLTSSE